jgi:hypothetical protein
MELVHMDLMGPFRVPSTEGATYLLTLLDDHSRFSVVQPLAGKAQVPGAVKGLLTLMETQSGHSLKAVQSDRGLEFCNKDLRAFYASRGVLHRTSAPYTPQQNGAAERLNRTLMERVRAMLISAQLPATLWDEAAETACYLRNLSPAAGKAVTPWEAFHGDKPDVSHLRVWGCAAWVKLLQHHEDGKLGPVSVPCRLVGYEPTSKAYRLQMDDSRQIVVSREVLFDERPTAAAPAAPQAPDADQLLIALELPDPASALPAAIAEHSNVSETVESAAEDQQHGLPEPSPAAHSPAAAAQAPPQPQPAPAVPAASQQPAASDSESVGSQLRRSVRVPRPAPQDPAFEYSCSAVGAAPPPPSDDPATYHEAMARPDADEWHRAMLDELASLKANGTWELVPCPPGVQPIPVRWVFKRKLDSRGAVERYKARLVAKGFKQREGIDFDEVYAPVSRHTTLRAFLAHIAAQDWELHQLDVMTAFLNGELDKPIFMQQPPGFTTAADTRLVCRMQKALYGLKQASRQWYLRISAELGKLGFQPTAADPSLYVRQGCAVLVYVDDLLIAAPDLHTVQQVKAQIGSAFAVRDLGEARYFLGMEIERDRATRTLRLSQQQLTNTLLTKFDMSQSKQRSVPLDPAARLVKGGEPELLPSSDAHVFMELVGSLLYLSTCTRPDIAQAVGALSRFMSCPTVTHLAAARGVLRYLQHTAGMGITFADPSTGLVGFCDADYAGDLTTRRSTSGFVFLLHGGAVAWVSRLQATVAVSTAEAEYMAAALASKEALWLRGLLADLHVPVSGPVHIHCDNQAALALIKHPQASARAKHIDVAHHFVRERVTRGEVAFSFIPTSEMVADCFTKALPPARFKVCRAGLGMS